MPEQHLTALIAHLSQITVLNDMQARQVIDEVLAYFNEDIESFIKRRHLELQQQGYSNARIFKLIQAELSSRLFPANQLSERKIRRVIYG